MRIHYNEIPEKELLEGEVYYFSYDINGSGDASRDCLVKIIIGRSTTGHGIRVYLNKSMNIDNNKLFRCNAFSGAPIRTATETERIWVEESIRANRRITQDELENILTKSKMQKAIENPKEYSNGLNYLIKNLL